MSTRSVSASGVRIEASDGFAQELRARHTRSCLDDRAMQPT
jgi:hypothetical protein